MSRPWAAVVVAAVALGTAGLVALDRQDSQAAQPPTDLGAEPAPMPVTRQGDVLTSVWYCPTLGASADGELKGAVTVFNPSATPLKGQVTFVPIDGAPVTVPLAVAEFGRVVLNPVDSVKSSFVSAMVELYGSDAVVDQTFTSGLGSSTSSCASSPSRTWYVADGATTADLSASLLLFNPFPDAAVVDVTFGTDEGPRTPQALQGYLVPPRSVRRIDVDEAMRRNTQVSTSVSARSGRVVAGWIQTYRSPQRRNVVATVPAPSAGQQWWFAGGRKGDGVKERLVLYNPSATAAADVTVSVEPADAGSTPIDPISVTVAPLVATTLDLSSDPKVPDGRHSLLVTADDPGIVAQRSLDLVGARNAATSQLGARLAAPVWYFATSPAAGSSVAITITNPLGIDATASVNRYGPAGPTPVAGGESLTVPAGGQARLELSGAASLDAPLEVAANGPVVAEQLVVPPANQPGATTRLGTPEVGAG